MMAKPLSIQRCEAKCSGHCVSGRACENLRVPDVRVVVHFTQCAGGFQPPIVPEDPYGFGA